MLPNSPQLNPSLFTYFKMGTSQNNDFDFPRFPPPPPSAKPPSPSKSSPPPPSQPFAPPPHHVHPPPRPSPSPDNHPTVIVIVFISFGGLLLLAFLAAALCCYIKKRKKKTVQETELIHFDEERKVKEAIVPGPFGSKSVLLTIEDDVHIDEIIRKNEQVGEGLHDKSAEVISGPHEEGASSSSVDHPQLKRKP
ncbi:hypothetical protein CIPAW_15G021500 [Carya illinoinensis]|uniref:Uncharacterized protein n=2 Tax=Carya illinoinensis TaxID=32201 RepID=A0A8T1N7U8_CARIL|nr:hypothetical protein CIPAW_15G021500 [Carya illinoinensis]KAG6674038.1 hypothetical protein I3842_15G022000 [Carya illinoinensis]